MSTIYPGTGGLLVSSTILILLKFAHAAKRTLPKAVYPFLGTCFACSSYIAGIRGRKKRPSQGAALPEVPHQLSTRRRRATRRVAEEQAGVRKGQLPSLRSKSSDPLSHLVGLPRIPLCRLFFHSIARDWWCEPKTCWHEKYWMGSQRPEPERRYFFWTSGRRYVAFKWTWRVVIGEGGVGGSDVQVDFMEGWAGPGQIMYNGISTNCKLFVLDRLRENIYMDYYAVISVNIRISHVNMINAYQF